MAIGDSERPTSDDGSDSFPGFVYSKADGKGKKRHDSISLDSATKKHVELRSQDGKTKKIGFVKKSYKHFKRFWICYGIAAVIFLSIFLPVL
jgi:hypothetical protein